MTTGKPWNDYEVRMICKVYAAMLAAEQSSIKFNKAAIRRGAIKHLDGRSEGSYEMKMQNISAAILANDPKAEYVKGYKPLKGYQRQLQIVIAQELKNLPYDSLYFLMATQEAGTKQKGVSK